MRSLIDELPAQLRWAADLEVPDIPEASSIIVTGMGGSGIAGDVGRLVAESEAAQVAVHKSYALPRWASSDDLVIAVSHSGNTEETLSALFAAQQAGCRIVGIATGGQLVERGAADGFPALLVPPGPQPRAAFGYLVGAVLRVLAGAGAISDQRAALGEAADGVEHVLGGPGHRVAAEIADTLVGRCSVIIGGAGVGAVAAARWKTQINENAKAAAVVEVLPEANHNMIVGWLSAPEFVAASFGAVFLEDEFDGEQIRLRAALTADSLATSMPVAPFVRSAGTSTIARLFSLSVVGDLVSVELAERTGVDPMPVHLLEELKQRLAEESS
jgi:glucose/mannose-6-phosphate isomerase